MGVFIETLSFTRTITTLPQSERRRETERQTDFWFHISGEMCIFITRFVLMNKVIFH